MDSETAIAALSALAQDHRLEVFRLLVRVGHEGLPAGEIARQLSLPASSLSFHLAQLQQAGLLHQTRDGRSLIYSADYTAMDRLMTFLTENCCGGDACAVTLRERTCLEQ